ncbi:MAG: carboxypeptidase regulatory-like domain-containing protein [Clostridiales bacterium]|nr:carboxypeptidase regulatory-like domain-containing protein [Clostridiales bacterium]
MPQTGSLVVRTYTSQAQLPVSGATVIISSREEDGRRKVFSIQTTDESGGTKPFQLEAPDRDLGMSPGQATPFSDYSLVVEHPGYFLATFEQLQVFPGVETVQNIPLVPLPQPAGGEDAAEPVVVTPQPL